MPRRARATTYAAAVVLAGAVPACGGVDPPSDLGPGDDSGSPASHDGGAPADGAARDVTVGDAPGTPTPDASEADASPEDATGGDDAAPPPDAPPSDAPPASDDGPPPGTADASDGGGAADACVPDPGFCRHRCGAQEDNCHDAVDCGGCSGGLTCIQGACGCAPDPVATTCAGKSCGTVTNNCGQTVACPDTCVAPFRCDGADAGPHGCGADCGGASGQACCSTPPACAAGLGCNGSQMCDPCFAPLPYPANCTPVSWATNDASASYMTETADKGADGDQCTDWNAGGTAPQYWGGHLYCSNGVCPHITKIGFLTNMLPDGSVTFQVELPDRGPGATVAYGPVTADMVNGKYYEFDVDLTPGLATGQSTLAEEARIDVTASPSWVSLREVVFLACQ